MWRFYINKKEDEEIPEWLINHHWRCDWPLTRIMGPCCDTWNDAASGQDNQDQPTAVNISNSILILWCYTYHTALHIARTRTYISQANCNLLLLLYIILLIRGMVKNGKRRPWCGGWKTWPNQSPINQRSISSIAQALLDHAIHLIPFPSHPPSYLSSEANKRECDT